MPSNETTVRTAKTRALLMRHINQQTEAQKERQFHEALGVELRELGVARGAMAKQLDGMAKHGQIDTIRVGRNVSYCKAGMDAMLPNGNGHNGASSAQKQSSPISTNGKQNSASGAKVVGDVGAFVEGLTVREARAIYAQLHEMFKKK